MRNESKTLPRLVASLKEFQERGGEIVCLDTGSTDDTPQIARDLGCKVTEVGERFLITVTEEEAKAINEKFVVGNDAPILQAGDRQFDYASARNFAATLASNDMVATPDCDEVYTSLNLDEIIRLITEGNDQLEYNFVFAHDAEGNPLTQFLHCKFYNRQKLKWANIIHEVLTPVPGAEPVKHLAPLPESVIKLEHFQNHETNRSHYLRGLAIDCFRNPQSDRNSHYFGRELMYTGRFRSAIKELARHVEMNAWEAEKGQSLIFIGDCEMALGEPNMALLHYQQAADVWGNRREPYMRIAEHYARQNKAHQALAYVTAALSVRGDNYYANYQPYYENIPHEIAYWACWQLGDFNNSKNHFDIAHAYKPFEPKYLHDMRFYYNLPLVTFVIPTLGRPEGLQRCVDSIKALNYPQEKIEIIVEEDEPRLGVPKRVKSMVEKAKGDWIVYASNDIEFTANSLISALKTALDNNKKLIAFNTQGEKGVSADEGNICEHFMIHKSMVKKLNGEIFDTEFNHVGVDNLLWAKMKKIGQEMWCKRAVVNHYHFSQKKSQYDNVYDLGWNEPSVIKDRETLERKLAELKQKPFNEI